MTLYEYQKKALTTVKAIPSKELEITKFTLGLVGESGEVAEKIKKWMRDANMQLDMLDREDLTKELGDVLWYVAVLADRLGVSLDEVGLKNVAKLQSRVERGVISGSGDNR